ncbi:hypothetical protein [Stutzerimonas kunmingensis]|uniref:hypothetical protein n=1 Tax=Stutzerimonas kunmingensis TaxID=1211807 RepID=UPI002897ED69|nr:hypothetical protein [Stutzerimonas kunmingensis]
MNRLLAWALVALVCFLIFTAMAVATRINREAGGPPLMTLVFTVAGLAAMFYSARGIIRAGRRAKSGQ